MSFNLNDFLISVSNLVGHLKTSGVLDQIIHGEGGIHKDIAIAEAGLTAFTELAPVFAATASTASATNTAPVTASSAAPVTTTQDTNAK